MSWRSVSLVLAVACAVLLWRDCTRGSTESAVADCRPARAVPPAPRTVAAHDSARNADDSAPGAADDADGGGGGGVTLYGFTVPSWAVWLAPHPGEDLRSYRDRMLPLARAAIAPQRARVARSRDAFAQLASLDARQRAELDAAATETAAALQDRVMSAVLGGELSPATFKPMAGVGVARELLDIVGRGNRRFLDSLRDDQRKALAQHPFDFADYLVFSTPWEDALGFLN